MSRMSCYQPHLPTNRPHTVSASFSKKTVLQATIDLLPPFDLLFSTATPRATWGSRTQEGGFGLSVPSSLRDIPSLTTCIGAQNRDSLASPNS